MVRIVLTFEGAGRWVGRGEPEASTPARILLDTERRHVSRVRRSDHRYSWLEDYLSQLDGKEARGDYYARLEG